MSYTFIISGLPGLDGEYPFPDPLTNRDLRTVKLMSGVRANEINEALSAGDNDVVIALATIALRRAEKKFSDDEIWDAPAGTSIEVREDKEGDDADPPAEPLENEPDAPKPASGSSSSKAGEPSPETTTRSGSGPHGSDTGAASDPETSPTLRQVS